MKIEPFKGGLLITTETIWEEAYINLALSTGAITNLKEQNFIKTEANQFDTYLLK